MTFDSLVAIVLSGLVLGSLYMLLASGLSLIWGTLKVFNFAHGFLLTLAAYLTWTALDGLESYPIAIFVGLVGTVIAGLLVERGLVRPFLNRPRPDLIVIITTLAAATGAQYAVQLVWGPRLKQLPRLVEGQFSILGGTLGIHELVLVVAAPSLMFVVILFLKYSKAGRAIRAVAQNPDSARLLGIDVGASYRLSFGISAGLAAVAGILFGGMFLMTPAMGTDPLLRAFIVVVLGGLGSLTGTFFAAYLIGIFEAAATFFVGLYWTPLALFVLLVIVLFGRPSGLLGRTQ